MTVPLGTFDAYRLEVDFAYQSGSRRKMTFWYEPNWGYALKMVVETRNGNGTVDINVREMTQRQRGAAG